MPTTDRKLRVFLCHSSQDKPIVRELYQRLLAEDWIDPWLDEVKLFPGQDWDIEIEKAVEATDAVVVLLSSNSVTKEGYVQKELRFVLSIADEKPEGAIFVIPLRLDDCPIPRRLRDWQYVDYFPIDIREGAYSRLQASFKLRGNDLGILESQISKAQDDSKSPNLSPLQEFRVRAGDFHSSSLKLRQIAAIEIVRISTELSLREVFSFSNSIIPGERVACGLALREKIKADKQIGNNSEVKKVIMALLTDKDSRVRYRALELLPLNETLYHHFYSLVEIMVTKDRNKAVREQADFVLHG